MHLARSVGVSLEREIHSVDIHGIGVVSGTGGMYNGGESSTL